MDGDDKTINDQDKVYSESTIIIERGFVAPRPKPFYIRSAPGSNFTPGLSIIKSTGKYKGLAWNGGGADVLRYGAVYPQTSFDVSFTRIDASVYADPYEDGEYWYHLGYRTVQAGQSDCHARNAGTITFAFFNAAGGLLIRINMACGIALPPPASRTSDGTTGPQWLRHASTPTARTVFAQTDTIQATFPSALLVYSGPPSRT